MTLTQFVLLAVSSLFAIVDPIATVPTFLAMTPNDTAAQRIRTARIACFVAAGVLVTFAVTGRLLFAYFGISVAAFQMAGSIILLLVALDMLRAVRSRVSETPEETDAGAAKDDIAITPLGIPLIAGPGAISTVILLHNKAQGVGFLAALLGSILLVCALTYAIFALSAQGARWLNPILLRLITRLMGLFLASIAMQFLVNALRELGVIGAPAL